MKTVLTIFVALLPAAVFAQEPPVRAPLGIPSVPWLKINPLTREKVDLGARLFFDKRLSRDGTIACATCHDPDKGWADGRKTARGIDGQIGERNVPTVVNASWQRFQFHDGRAWNLEGQALEPIQNPTEMDLSLEELERRIRESEYADEFEIVFGRAATATDVAFALASFERTLLAGHSRYDRFVAGNRDALSPQERAGAQLFFGKARCNECHSGPSYSDGLFHVAGVGWRDEPHGREVVTGDKAQRGSWKTPTLRDLARTAPYMHDGSMATLEEVVEHYDRGSVPKDGGRVPNLDEELKPMFLTPTEKSDLVFFLKDALLSGDYPQRPK
jgi:cytochrome c peroxidase